MRLACHTTHSSSYEPQNKTAVPPYLEREFLSFMNGTMGRDYEDIKFKREIQRVDIDPETVQSGDYLPTFRTDGLNAMIMYGTGAAVGHNTMALRFDGELYVVESDTPVIRRTPWKEWLDTMEEKGYQVAYHRLSDEKRALFDEEKA